MLANFGVGQVLWSMIWLFLIFMAFWLIITILGDIFRSDDMSGLVKAVWIVVIIFTPYIGSLIYLIVRGGSMTERSIKNAQLREEAFREYVQQAAGPTPSTSDELARLADLHADGKLDDSEYAAAKAKVIGG